MKRGLIAAGALCYCLLAQSASSAVLFSFEETAGGVVSSLSGSLDLAGAGYVGSGGSSSFIVPNNAAVIVGGWIGSSIDVYEASGPTSFGSGTTSPGDGVGDAFGVVGVFQRVAVPQGYTSGSPLASTLTFAGATFASLGITPGQYVYSLPNDTVTLQFGSTAVIPLPATLPLLLGAVALGFAAVGRRG